MRLIVWLLIIVLALIILLFEAALKIKLLLDTSDNQYNVSMQWLYPFLEVEMAIEDTMPMLTVFLFKKKFYRKQITAGKNKRTGLMKAVKPENVRITAAYGFQNPAVTGMISGLAGAAGAIFGVAPEQYPDYAATRDYVRVDAQATVNMGETLLNYTKQKR